MVAMKVDLLVDVTDTLLVVSLADWLVALMVVEMVVYWD